MFRTVPLAFISFSLCTQQWYMSYRFVDSKPVWHTSIPLPCVQWKTRSVLIPLACSQLTCMTYYCCVYSEKLVPSWSCSQAVSKPVWHIPLLCVRWTTPDDGQRNCPKHVEFYSKNKLEKLVHVVGFVIRTNNTASPAVYTNRNERIFIDFSAENCH